MGDDNDSDGNPHEEKPQSGVSRREWMGLASVGALTTISGSVVHAPFRAGSGVEPPESEDWELVFEDAFEGDTLDKSTWEVGFGWGDYTHDSPEVIVEENVFLEDGRLHLAGTHDDDTYQAGAVNTKDSVYFGPGSYWEARLKLPDRVGFLPVFWAKPNDGSWPPEIDVVELFQTGSDQEDTHVSQHNVHYSKSTEPADQEAHIVSRASHDAGVDLTADFHVYGCEWRDERVAHYVDGVKVAERTDETILESLANGAPFHALLNVHINRIGTADHSERWGEALVADWVRIWEHVPGDTTANEDDENWQYLWVQAADSGSVTYEFSVRDGEIWIDTTGPEDGSWVSEDRTTAGGTFPDEGGDGYWLTGEIGDLWSDGPIETYVNDEYVDPDELS